MFELKSKKLSGTVPEPSAPAAVEAEGLESSAGNSAMLGMLGAGKKLPEDVRGKMETSFNADFSGVQVYESGVVGEMGAEAFAKGNMIGFDKGKYNPDSQSGQALLGHELSHVVQQARGEVSAPMAKGLMVSENSALESRADREGEKAAKGESVGVGLSPLSAGMSAGSQPVQLKSGESKKQRKQNEEDASTIREAYNTETNDDRARKLSEVAYRHSMTNDISEQNMELFGLALKSTDNGFLDSLMDYQVESSHRLNQTWDALYQEGLRSGMDDDSAKKAASFKAKYTPEADQLQSTQTLLRRLFMEDETGEKTDYYMKKAAGLADTPDTKAAMDRANENVLLFGDQKAKDAMGGQQKLDATKSGHQKAMAKRLRDKKKKWSIFS